MIKHILLPTDLGPRAHIALKHALEIGHSNNAKITLLNVHREFMTEEEMEMLRVSVESIMNRFEKSAKESKAAMLAEVKAMGGDDLEIEYILSGGKPGKEAVKVARELNVDMIILCSDGKDNVKDWMKGTITEQIINNAPCPVLVIPYQK